MTKHRSVLLLTSALIGLVSLGLAGAASAADQTYQFDIPAEPLGQALTDFSQVSSQQIIMSEDVAKGRTTKGLHGRYTAEQALAALLAGTDLKVETNAAGVLMVRPKNAQAASNEAAAPVETVVVTGTSIHGLTPESSPVVTYTNSDIRSLGSLTIEQFLENLPQNFASYGNNSQLATLSASHQEADTTIDLRGLGPGSTLVLINGHRLSPAGNNLAPDVSLIPLSAVERIDVLDDGASAIYGADAVGGVVNIVLRSTLEGAESHIEFGGATRGGDNETRLVQDFGHDWGSGNALLSYSYTNLSGLDASQRSFSSSASPFTLMPPETRQNVLANLNQSLDSDTQINANFLYSDRHDSFVGQQPISSIYQQAANAEHQYFSSAEIDRSFGASANFSASVSYNSFGGFHTFQNSFVGGPVFSSESDHLKTTNFDSKAQVDGSLLDLPAGPLKYAVGGGYSRETYNANLTSTALNYDVSESRSNYYFYGELHIPVVSAANAIPFVQRLDLDLAGRYTSYSDFGSQFDPKIGALWSPVDGLKLRGNFSKSFRAPPLAQLSTVGNYAEVFSPAGFGFNGYSPSTMLLFVAGTGNPGLQAEHANTWSLGTDIEPSAIPGLKASGTYYAIDYKGRILPPDPSQFAYLPDPGQFASAFVPNPSATQIAAAIAGADNVFNATAANPNDPAALASVVTLLFDDRPRNLATSRQSGIDFSADYTTGIAWGAFSSGGHATYILQDYTQVFPTSGHITQVGEIFHPPHFKGQLYAGLASGMWSIHATVDYIGAYTNQTSAVTQHVESWTTVNLNVNYDFGSLFGGGFVNDVDASLTIRNLFDQSPPFVVADTSANTSITNPIGFDPTNANPVGRFIGGQVVVKW